MFNEGQLYSPVTRDEDGQVQVHLGEDHPGFTDPEYRARRSQIAEAALSWQRGEPLPEITYTEAEHDVWRTCASELAPKHRRYAAAEFLAGKRALDLPVDRVPQLGEVGQWLAPQTGWTYLVAPGLVPLRDFYADLGARRFNSTQYLRHPSEPLYTPEPDVIHEVMGHANQLAAPRFAALTAAAGQASARLEEDASLKFVADVFWFTLEFGVVYERGELQAYGAGILSSYGEMDEFRGMHIRGLDLAAMGTQEYDITRYQPLLFAADSLDQLDDVVGTFFETVDDDTVARLRAQAGAAAPAG